jgi:hypothetical protein
VLGELFFYVYNRDQFALGILESARTILLATGAGRSFVHIALDFFERSE